ncbi:uncharacterized protein PITG_05572 [Phytophthora infestans T30-4]|uniref:Uncharacterized protein n=1 Tax=Phytophthora infestans (strain T30-4) TaxID=403677 RepID=D0N354_PHYIT|nr:uncharacterized protein PITG_05572 [Phytophthora infestans T30-4]EEY69346.1 hypothetical protein PITG_05572 [Phytophthora infestans T30-4]|eukprot:XP_002999200.1 hypothetical protein PITG_05572 [Phytophthora infestans T30-4]
MFDTGRVGLDVYTTTFVDVKGMIGEYTGEINVPETVPDTAALMERAKTSLIQEKHALDGLKTHEAKKEDTVRPVLNGIIIGL